MIKFQGQAKVLFFPYLCFLRNFLHHQVAPKELRLLLSFDLESCEEFGFEAMNF